MSGARGRSKKLPKTAPVEELEALLRMPNTDCPTGLRDRCVLGVMYQCGLRVREACKLDLRDVRWREQQIHVRPEVGKGGREGFVYVPDSLLPFLERWKAVRRPYAAAARKTAGAEVPWLFITLRGTQLDRRDVWAMCTRRARKAGIRHVHPHMLRHSFATELLGEGLNLREVQTLLRHADVRTTTLYTHIVDADLQRKVTRR